MRSRYTAYVKQDADYLIATWHPSCQAEQWRRAITDGFIDTEWHGLTIAAQSAGNHADEAFVEFIARFTEGGSKPRVMHERSRFLRIEQRWYYIDGIQIDGIQIDGTQIDRTQINQTRPKTGRNAVCPCGSGKKYKKCCGR